MDWVKKNKDWLITLAVFSFFGLILLLSSIFFSGGSRNEPPLPTVEEEATFDLPKKQGSDSSNEGETAPLQTTSFYLRPSPDELLDKLEGLNQQEFRKETKNLPGLRIMWPAFFFSIVKVENEKAEVMFDASEDGFGVMLVTEIDVVQFPEILKKKQGDKIWLAAEITGIDPTGTGQFFLKTEYVRFDDYSPQPMPAQASSANK